MRLKRPRLLTVVCCSTVALTAFVVAASMTVDPRHVEPASAAEEASAAPAIRWPSDGMEGVLVPGGEFVMGSESEDPAAEAHEKPAHQVHVGSFWIDRYEVTNAQFARFVAETSYETVAEQLGHSYGFVGAEFSAIRGANWRHPAGPDSSVAGLEEHPVVAVGWRDAAAYCRWANRRLPTEAEWEKAARGTDGRRYPWGDSPPDATRVNLADRSSGLPWAEQGIDDGYARTAPVGTFPGGAGPFGALDMAGNAWEWAADWYDPIEYTGRDGARNPAGPEQGVSRVLRGGSFDDDALHVRSARRSKDDLDFSSNEGGFRCAASGRALLPLVQRPEPLPTATVTPRPIPTPTSQPDVCIPLNRGDYGTLSIEGRPSDRPAENHPDLNLAIRGYNRSWQPRGLVDYGGPTDRHAPKLVGLLGRLPTFASVYRVNHWDWQRNSRGGPIGRWAVTLLGLGTRPGEPVEVPSSGYDLGEGKEVLVLYATERRITLKYTREDNVVIGYTVHLEHICVDPPLLELYRNRNSSGRSRLPALRAGQPFGTARSTELLVAIRDTGRFMDPRSRKDWWPGLSHRLGLSKR